MSESKPSDRRKEPRVHSLNLVNVEEFAGPAYSAEVQVGRTLDLSIHGVRVELTHPLPLRAIVTLQLALDGELIEVGGRVRHLEALEDGLCSVGVELLRLSADAKALIENYLEHTSEEAG
jgi:hypothetical protein